MEDEDGSEGSRTESCDSKDTEGSSTEDEDTSSEEDGSEGDSRDKNPVQHHPRLENRLKRITLSARATSGLQTDGMTSINKEVADELMKKPRVYGLPKHYDVSNIWGATNAHHHTMMGTRPPRDPSVDMRPVCYTKIFTVADNKQKKRKRQVVHHISLSKYKHIPRTRDRFIWPKTNPKLMVSVKSAAVMMISEPVVDLLIDAGTLPLVKHPRPSKKGEEVTFMDIPFGPCLDLDTNQPLLPGKCRTASSTYSRYGMKLLTGNNEAWKATPCAGSSIFVRLPEKNGLPVGELGEQLSPIAEMERISDGKGRLGFIVHRSGGNCTLKGQAPPAEASRSAGEGAFFEHAQSIKNPHNFAMEILVEQGTPVAVWGAGDLVPTRYRDPDLASNTDSAEQVFYFGCYKIQRSASQPGKKPDELLEVIREYKADYPKLAFQNLRFLLKDHHSYILVPVDYPEIKGGYHYLPVDIRDNRRPMFQVPGKQSFETALGAENGDSFNETSMLTEWYKDGGIDEFSNRTFEPKLLTKGRKRKAADDDEIIQQDESAFRLLAPQEGTGDKEPALGEFEKKSRSLAEQWDVVLNCSIGSFSRLMELNVDRDGNIGPLLDQDPAYHHDSSSLDNYSMIFGERELGVGQRYLKQLSPVSVQKSATTTSVRAYDAGKLLLMLGNGGCSIRVERKGIGFITSNLDKATDMLLQCFLVEVVRVPILMEWSDMKNQSNGTTGVTLPSLGDIDDFLDFISDVMSVNKFQTTRNLLQTQYEIHTGFGSAGTFTRVLRYLGRELSSWMSFLMGGMATRAEGVDGFDICRNSLATKLSGTEAMGSWNDDKMQFFTQHVLMNMNELVDDWPFGIPKKVVLGFGGLFGAKRLVRGMEEVHSVQEVLHLQLKAVREKFSERELTMMGLERLEGTSEVVVSINRRPICLVETEHFGCLDMISSERETGGSRGSGNRYDVTSPHCHPVPHARYYSRSKEIHNVAVAAIKEYKARVDEPTGGGTKTGKG